MDSTTAAMIDEAKQAIVEKAGKHLRLLILYGSEARGEATPDSDIDMLAVLDVTDPTVEESISDAVYDVMWKYDFPRLISLLVMNSDDFQSLKRKGFSFVRNVEEEGVVLWQAA